MQLDPQWQFVGDTVMGGQSRGSIAHQSVAGRAATRLTGLVSLANNGGFVQMAADLGAANGLFDASAFDGIEMDVYGNDETYELRLRTDALTRPWQSFRAEFRAPAHWTRLRIGFDALEAHRTEARFDPSRLRRIGLLAIGRAFTADLAVADLGLYRADAP